MTGFRNRLSVARCCCVCTDCCNGSYPTEWDAAFTIADSMCTTCNEFIEGTYNLTFSGGLHTSLQTCSWGYYWTNPDGTDRDSCLAKSTPYSFDGFGWLERFLKFRVSCISATQYRIQLVLGISAQGFSGAGNAQRFDFEKYVDVADWTCDAVADYCIPLSYWQVGYLGADFWSGSGFRTWTGAGDYYKKLCEPPTEICVTAIP